MSSLSISFARWLSERDRNEQTDQERQRQREREKTQNNYKKKCKIKRRHFCNLGPDEYIRYRYRYIEEGAPLRQFMVLVQTLRGGGDRQTDTHTHTQTERRRETELRKCRLGQQRESIYSERGRH